MLRPNIASILEGWKDDNGVAQYQDLLYVPEIMCSKLISCHYIDLLVGYFEIDKIQELVAKKYHWPIFYHNIKIYVRGYDVCLASKTVCYKSYRDLKLLPVLTYYKKNLLIDFMTDLPWSINQKGDSYGLVLIIVDCWTKIVYYKPVKVTINALKLEEVIIIMIV